MFKLLNPEHMKFEVLNNPSRNWTAAE